MQSREDEELAHSLMMQFKTSPQEPNEAQLKKIKAEIAAIAQKRTPTNSDWRESVRRHCPSTGQYLYEGMDNSDLNALLIQALQALRK